MSQHRTRTGRRRDTAVSRAGRIFALACVGAALVATLFACASVLGIEDKPLRVEGDAGSSADAMSDAGDGDAGDTCNRFESRACTADCPRDFCDDFDGDGQAPETRWITPPGFQNPFVRGDSGITLTPQGNSPPMALSARTGNTSAKTYATIAHLLAFSAAHPNQQFDGVRIAADVRVDALTFTGTGGPVKDAGSAAVFGMLHSAFVPPKGIAIVFSGRSVVLDVSEDVLGSTGAEVVGVVAPDIDPSFLRDNWLQIALFVGDRDRAVKLGYAKCAAPEITPGLVAVASLAGKYGVACLNVPATFGDPSWPQDAIILAGSLMFGPGEAAFRIDNVVADFFVK